MDAVTLRQNLAEAVERSGKSHRKIAEEGGFAHTLLPKFLNGTTDNLAVDTLQRAAPVLDTTVGALLGEVVLGETLESEGEPSGILLLYPEQLFPSPLNPRRDYDEEAIEALAASIEQNGLLQNLVVREVPAHETGGISVSADGEPLDAYWIVSGERRWRAVCHLVRQKRWPVPAMPGGTLPCRVLLSPVDHDDAEEAATQHRILALLENLQREDLPPLDEALAFEALGKLKWSTESIAGAIHKTTRYVQQRVALLKLMPATREALAEGRITVSQARALARANPTEQPELLKRIEREELETERQIDEAAKEIARRNVKPADSGDGRLHLASPGSVGPRESEGGERDGSDRGSGDEAEAPAGAEVIPARWLNDGFVILPDEVAAELKQRIDRKLHAGAKHGDAVIGGGGLVRRILNGELLSGYPVYVSFIHVPGASPAVRGGIAGVGTTQANPDPRARTSRPAPRHQPRADICRNQRLSAASQQSRYPIRKIC